LTYLMLGTN